MFGPLKQVTSTSAIQICWWTPWGLILSSNGSIYYGLLVILLEFDIVDINGLFSLLSGWFLKRFYLGVDLPQHFVNIIDWASRRVLLLWNALAIFDACCWLVLLWDIVGSIISGLEYERWFIFLHDAWEWWWSPIVWLVFQSKVLLNLNQWII